jgi:hypothetical protein
MLRFGLTCLGCSRAGLSYTLLLPTCMCAGGQQASCRWSAACTEAFAAEHGGEHTLFCTEYHVHHILAAPAFRILKDNLTLGPTFPRWSTLGGQEQTAYVRPGLCLDSLPLRLHTILSPCTAWRHRRTRPTLASFFFCFSPLRLFIALTRPTYARISPLHIPGRYSRRAVVQRGMVYGVGRHLHLDIPCSDEGQTKTSAPLVTTQALPPHQEHPLRTILLSMPTCEYNTPIL